MSNTGNDVALFRTSQKLLDEENAFIWRGSCSRPDHLAGIALSGGGIRAATVALGVLQVLAENNLLARFQFLSTVSGGGYTGSALSWFWSRKRVNLERSVSPDSKREDAICRFGTGPIDFPFQETLRPSDHRTVASSNCADSLDCQLDHHLKTRQEFFARASARNLTFLRNHGSYLTSGDGIGFAGLIVAVLRTIILSLSVWLPVLVVLFVGIRTLEAAIAGNGCVASAAAPFDCHPIHKWSLLAAAAAFTVFYSAVILFSFLTRWRLTSNSTSARRRYSTIVSYSLLSVASLFVLCSTFQNIALENLQPAMGAQSIALVFALYWGVMLASAQFWSPRNPGYFLRRSFEKFSSTGLPIFVAAIYFGMLPAIVSRLTPAPESTMLASLGSIGAVLTLLSGIGTALYGYYLKAKSIVPSLAGQALAILGSIFFLAGLVLVCFAAAQQFAEIQKLGTVILYGLLLLAFIAFWVGWLGSVNETGLHRFYRDRLMETFMPMAVGIRSGDAQQSDVADNLLMTEIVDEYPSDRPYHIINTHVILTEERDPKTVVRGGDNFIVSPAFVGSSRTGWVRTPDYIARHGALTLATAMATSGAAANANAGYIGTGITRDRFVSAVMAILNIRLGVWVGNPRAVADISELPADHDKSRVHIRRKLPTYFWPVLTSGILGKGNNSRAKFLELSDGGHFENLGLYELVRRRLDLILVVDAEQDENISLSSLVSAHNRIREDFNVELEFIESKGAEVLLGQTSDRYPGGVKLAKSPFIVATIKYPQCDDADAKDGTLIYIKSTMIPGLSFSTDGYRASNPAFPHQTTNDQFFDPDQFEAYRDLGKQSCALMIKNLGLSTNFTDRAKILDAYRGRIDPATVQPLAAGME